MDLAANGFANAAFFAAGAALPLGGATTFLMPFVDAATAFALGGGLAPLDAVAAGFGLLKKLKPWQLTAATRRMAMVRIIFRVTCDRMIR